jgi:hypothetical protein
MWAIRRHLRPTKTKRARIVARCILRTVAAISSGWGHGNACKRGPRDEKNFCQAQAPGASFLPLNSSALDRRSRNQIFPP